MDETSAARESIDTANFEISLTPYPNCLILAENQDLMATEQQEETLNYFRENAEDWRSKATGRKSEVNVIEQRNNFVVEVARERSSTKTALDVGCGTGELTCDLAKTGCEATGLDFSPEMIDLAEKKSAEEEISAHFHCSSIFDFEIPAESYDVISANGLIEYISLEEMERFFDIVASSLTPGGSFVVGSRNRLFNLTTMNEYTAQEVASEGFTEILNEAIKWNSTQGIPEVNEDDCPLLQPADTEHKLTGIQVTTRFQYSPFQLIKLLQDRGLKTLEIYPVHIHGVTPVLRKEDPDLHAYISNLLQSQARNCNHLIVNASTFMLHAKKI